MDSTAVDVAASVDRSRIFGRIVVACTLAAIMLTTIVWLDIRADERRHLIRVHLRGETMLAETGAGSIAAILEDFGNELDRLSRVPSVRYLEDSEQLETTLASFLRRTPIDSVAVVRVDTAGRVLLIRPENGVPEAVLSALAESGYLRQAGQSATRMLAGPLTVGGRGNFVAISDRIRPSGGPSLGAVIGVFPAAVLALAVEDIESEGNRSVAVRLGDGPPLHGSATAAGQGPYDLVAEATIDAGTDRSPRLELRTTREYATAPLRESRPDALLLLFLANAVIASGGAFLLRESRLRARLAEGVRQRRELESRLEEAHRLEALGKLAGAVAHDFNNIVTVVMSSASVIEEHAARLPSLREESAALFKASEHAAGLTRQLLSFARQQTLRPRRIDLNDELRRVEPLLVRALGPGVRLIVDARALTPAINFDPIQLEQVVLNLASNARDAMPDGGQIRITTLDVTVSEQAREPGLLPGTYVRLIISDTGHGISPDAMPRIFEPFFTTKPAQRGTGLGLATVHGILRQSGAHVEVDSRVGEGTHFIISIPAAARFADGGRMSPNAPTLAVSAARSQGLLPTRSATRERATAG